MLAAAPYGSKLKRRFAALDAARGRSRRSVEVMAFSVTGLILLEKSQTAVCIATVLPGRAHDTLNRLPRVLPWSPQHLILGLIRWVHRQGSGDLCLDDEVVGETFRQTAHRGGVDVLAHSKQGHVFGFRVVLLFGYNKTLRIPVGFHLSRPKRDGQALYRIKMQLAQA